MNARRRRLRTVLTALVAMLAAAATASAKGSFGEPNVRVLHEFDGTTPGALFGWAVSELGRGDDDDDDDRRADAIVGEPFNGADGATGSAYVYSTRNGRLVHRFDGGAGDWAGFAIADAMDVDGDETHDILVGAPGTGAGHVDLYSGRDGKLLHRFAGEQAGDSFGWAVSSAGDVNRDGRPDMLVGASAFRSGAGPGRAYIYSGRTYELIRTLAGDKPDDEFGSGVGWSPDLNGDRVPDQIVGARDAGAGRRGEVYVYSGKTGTRILTIEASPQGGQFGSFFVAGVGDVDGDRTPDVYVGDYADGTNGAAAGRASVYSGRTGDELRVWLGSAPGDGLGPGRGAGDVNDDGRPDLIVGSFSSSDGADQAGKVQIFSGADGSVLRTITSTRPLENFGFDAVGVGDVNGDDVPDALVSAASGDRVYVIAGRRPRDP